MKNIRMFFLLLIIASGITLAALLAFGKLTTPLASSFAPAFQLLGITTKTINSTLSRLVPVNELDEKELGDILAAEYDAGTDTTDPDYIHLNALLAEIGIYSKKPFQYRAYIADWNDTNAFALPGGVIMMTRELYTTLGSDSEIVAILAHEMGHIELGHCFDSVRFELLARKTGNRSLLEILDFSINFLLRYSYSKYQENQADDYSFELLVQSDYDPLGLASSFKKLRTGSSRARENADIIRDYSLSHPPLPIRIEKYEELAAQWKNAHMNEIRKR